MDSDIKFANVRKIENMWHIFRQQLTEKCFMHDCKQNNKLKNNRNNFVKKNVQK